MFEKLDTALRATAKEIRDTFNDRDVGHMELEIRVSGRTNGDSLKIEYKIRENYDEQVRGGVLEPVLDEFFRRRGWKECNAPLAIPYVESVEESVDESSDVE